MVVRKSNFRNVYGVEGKQDSLYTDLRVDVPAWDSNFIKANSKFFAVPYGGGGGSIAVLNVGKTGKVGANAPLIAGHTSQVLDFDFNPFNDNIIATGSADCTVKIWGIPEGGLKDHLKIPLVKLDGHSKKVGFVQFHPSASNILCTTGGDKLIKFWDIENGKESLVVKGHNDVVQSLSFDWAGSQLATSCKDKKIRIIDPRASEQIVAETAGDEGTKGGRIVWMGKYNKIYTVGFSKQSERIYNLFDPKKFDKPLLTEQIDISAGLYIPLFDEDTGNMFLCGKGDANISYYECVDHHPYIYYINTFKSTTTQAGACMVPKYCVDTTQCEIVRILKLSKGVVTPVSFIVPRKSEAFQDDIFPNTRGQTAAVNAADWLSGKDGEVNLISMEPGKNKIQGFKLNDFQPKIKKSEEKEVKLPPKTNDPKELLKQNDELRKRVEEVEKKNFKLENEIEELKKKLATPKTPAKEEEIKKEVKEEIKEEEKPIEEEKPVEQEKPIEEEKPVEEIKTEN